MSDEPLEPIEALIAHQRWTANALRRATGEAPATPPEGESSVQRFARDLNERATLERADEELARRVAFLNPRAPTRASLEDPLRELARAQIAGRRAFRRRPMPQR